MTVYPAPKPAPPVTVEGPDVDWVRAYYSPERVAAIRRMPCLTCGATPSENAHVGREGAGVSRKADYTQIVPLCTSCHHELHQYGSVVQKFGYGTGQRISKAALAMAAEIIQGAWERIAAREDLVW